MPDKFAAAIRNAETGTPEGDYAAVRGLVRGQARLLGAYGVASDEWDRLAEENGYAGARWQDRRAQDRVMKGVFEALYRKYGDWRLVATAWKGGEAVADALAADPSLIKHDQLAGLRDYVETVMNNVGDEPYETETLTVNSQNVAPAMPEIPERAQTALTGVLYMLRSRQRAEAANRAAGGEEVA